MLMYLYVLILTGSIFFAGLSYRNVHKEYEGLRSQKILKWFLLLIVLHSSLILFVKTFFAKESYVFLGMPLGFFYTPLFYSFCKAYIDELEGEGVKPEKSYLKEFWIHYLLGGVYSVVYFFSIVFEDFLDESYFDNYYFICYLSLGVQLIIYAFLGYVKITSYSFSKGVSVLFLRAIWAMIFQGTIVIGLVLYDAVTTNEEEILYFGILGISISVFLYSLERKNEGEDDKDKQEQVVNDAVVNDSAIDLNKYEKSKLGSELVEEYREKIDKIMLQEEYYLLNNCSLELIEQVTKIPRHHLSQFFSKEYEMNFNTYINKLRITHAKKILANHNYEIPVQELGVKSGFNSRTSFFRSFKNFEGVSPSEYIEIKLGQLENNKQL